MSSETPDLETQLDENPDPKTHVYIVAGRRLAMMSVMEFTDWYISHSPRNGNQNAEGPWSEWVQLAKLILAEDERRKSHAPIVSEMIK